MPDPDVTHALSFDIEDWFHMVEIDAVDDPDRWDAFPSIVERETEWILETLRKRGITATFYVLGWIADRYPDLVRSIDRDGHEIGSHSFWHRRVDTLTREEFRADVRDSLDAIRAAGVDRCPGFRAPTFSIVPGAEWAFDELLDLGFEYDASLFPMVRQHGGYPCSRDPHRSTIAPSGRPMPELPMSIMDLGPRATAFSGGGFFRLFPKALIRRGFDQCEAAGRPVVVYMHPRDFAVDTPHVEMSRIRRFKCYVGIRGARAKFEWMLDNWRFTSCEKVLSSFS